MAMLLPLPRPQFTDGNGAPLVGGSVAYCTPGTAGNTYRPVYADEAETTPLTNPVPLDSAGIPFSGGSQVSTWGFGQYEVFVRDSQRNLIYSGLIDTPGGLQGGTIEGSVQIQGDLSVTGNITDALSINTGAVVSQNGLFTGTLTAANAVISYGTIDYITSQGITSSGDIDAGGNLNVTGNINADGNITGATISGTTLLNDGYTVPKIVGGIFTSAGDGNPNLVISFPAPFNSVISIMVTPGVSVDNNAPGGPTIVIPELTPVITGGSLVSFSVTLTDGNATTPGFQYVLYWVAFGS